MACGLSAALLPSVSRVIILSSRPGSGAAWDSGATGPALTDVGEEPSTPGSQKPAPVSEQLLFLTLSPNPCSSWGRDSSPLSLYTLPVLGVSAGQP